MLKTSGLNQTEISKILLVNKSTVCRELKRNIPLRGRGAKVYVAKNTQKKQACGTMKNTNWLLFF